MAGFDKRTFDELSHHLAASPGRYALVHLSSGSTLRCTQAVYSEIKDQGGGMRFRGLSIQDDESPDLQRASILADAVIAFELRGPKG